MPTAPDSSPLAVEVASVDHLGDAGGPAGLHGADTGPGTDRSDDPHYHDHTDCGRHDDEHRNDGAYGNVGP